jgi:hypothetical protein
MHPIMPKKEMPRPPAPVIPKHAPAPKIESIQIYMFKFNFHMERMHYYHKKCHHHYGNFIKYRKYYRQFKFHRSRMQHYHSLCYPQYRMDSSYGYGSRMSSSTDSSCGCGCTGGYAGSSTL